MPQLHAQPYNTDATGFNFDDYTDYEEKSADHFDRHGNRVEEYEIQYIDGDDELDMLLFNALSIDQSNLEQYLDACATWDDDQKLKVVIILKDKIQDFNIETDDPDRIELDIYEVDSMQELAEQFVDEGLYGPIPKSIANYIDYDAIARDLNNDYAEITIANTNYIYRCN